MTKRDRAQVDPDLLAVADSIHRLRGRYMALVEKCDRALELVRDIDDIGTRIASSPDSLLIPDRWAGDGRREVIERAKAAARVVE